MVVFRRNWEVPFTEAAHAVCHITKAVGKLAAECDNAGHGRTARWSTWIADVIISAEGLASTVGVEEDDLQKEYERRLKEKNT
jgi:hypothetical protein